MDLITLAPLIVTALTPLFKELGNKALEKIAEKSGEEIFNQRVTILEKVKNVFAGEELTTLGLLAENPEDPKIQGKIEGKLEERLKANPDVAGELETLVARLNAMTSEITNRQIEDSDIVNEMKRSGTGGGKSTITNEGIRGSKIRNTMN